jgi:hypothetical protein
VLTQQVVVVVGTTGKDNSGGKIWRKYRMFANWNYSESISSVVNPDPVSGLDPDSMGSLNPYPNPEGGQI